MAGLTFRFTARWTFRLVVVIVIVVVVVVVIVVVVVGLGHAKVLPKSP